MDNQQTKPIEDWTMDELNAAGFDAFQQREQIIGQVRQLEQAINAIALEKQRRKDLEKPHIITN